MPLPRKRCLGPKNRLRICPTDLRRVWGPIRAERASDFLKPSVGHLATKARFAPIGDRAGIGRGKQGIENCEQRVVGRRADNRQWRRCPSAEKHRLASSLGGAGEPEASPLVSSNEPFRYIAYKAHGSVPMNRAGGRSWPLADRPRPPPMTEKRKLAAILAADVVGYSRLAGADEERTLARLRALRSDLIDPAIAVHHGRVVKRTGDGAS